MSKSSGTEPFPWTDLRPVIAKVNETVRDLAEMAESYSYPPRFESETPPLEGAVVEYDRTRLPQAFIEFTTEYDYAELPDYLRADLERWCDVFRAWDQSKRREEGR